MPKKVKVQKLGVILGPTTNKFEDQGVLNPAIYQDGDNIHLIYRAISKDEGSCLGYARLSGPTTIAERWDKPFMLPQRKEESKGMEDPRIVKIDDTFYMTYVAHDGKNAISSYAYGPDLFKLKRGGVISPKIQYRDAVKIFRYSKLKDSYYFFESFYREFNGSNILIWHKDFVLFPELIDGRFRGIQRILPDAQMVDFEDFGQLKDKYFWIFSLMNLGNNVILEGEHGFDSRHVGAGAPPIRTRAGWLVIFHTAQEMNKKRVYHAGAALLDINNPNKVMARLPMPLFSPDQNYEIEGTVNDVVFPTGTAQFGNDLYIYYGAADSKIAVAKVDMEDLITTLLQYPR